MEEREEVAVTRLLEGTASTGAYDKRAKEKEEGLEKNEVTKREPELTEIKFSTANSASFTQEL